VIHFFGVVWIFKKLEMRGFCGFFWFVLVLRWARFWGESLFLGVLAGILGIEGHLVSRDKIWVNLLFWAENAVC